MDVMNVRKFSPIKSTSGYIRGSTHERNPMNVIHVKYLSLGSFTLLGIREFTQDRNLRSVTRVENPSREILIYLCIIEFTREKPCEWVECEKAFSQMSVLNTSESSHWGEILLLMNVRTFSSTNNLRVHQTVATWEKPYECNGYGETLTGSAASENSGEDQ